MRRGYLTRLATGPHGTFGELVFYAGDDLELGNPEFTRVTLELPYKRNLKGKSCVEAGVDVFKWRTDSPKHGACYEAAPRNGRDHVQVHSANLAGDAERGFVAQLEGCVALGESVAMFKGGVAPAGALDQQGIINSRRAVDALAIFLNRQPFELVTSWAPGVQP